MKKIGLNKKPFALIMSIILMLSVTVQAFAATAPFGTAGSGANPFTPRGYSIVENCTQYWLDSNYTHTYKIPTDNVHFPIWSDENNPANPLTKTYYVTSGEKQMYAWLNKGQLSNGYNLPFQRGFTTDSTVDVRDFFTVSINDGPFVSIPSVDSKGYNAFGFACRTIIDPDGLTNDWVYPLTFTLKPGTKYTFAFTRGFAANNGMSLILSPDVTADGKAGYTGVFQTPFVTAEQDQWAAHKLDIYQYAKSYTALGTGVNTGKTVYSVEFKDFYHTLQTYADLTTINSLLTEATTFVGGVTDNDYKLGNYRKSSVETLKTLINGINAKTDIKEELQTSVDALKIQLNDALNYAKEPAIFVKGITLDKNRADMNIGDTLTLKATVSPENADNPTVAWTSSNDKIATVENGVVKAVSAGNVSIKTTTADGGYTAICSIVINNIDKSVANTDSSVNVNYNTSVLPAGASVGSVKNTVITSGADKTSIVNALSNIGYTNLSINDVQLLDMDGKPITSLSGNVTVKIKIPDGAGNEALSVFWYNPATGELTNMNATQQQGNLVFTTNHFSYYVVVKANASTDTSKVAKSNDLTATNASGDSPKTSDNSAPITAFIVGGLSIAALLAIRTGRRRKNQAE